MNTGSSAKYKDVSSLLVKRFDIKNPMQIPKISKIVVSSSIGASGADKKMLEQLVTALSLVTGRKPVIIKARKSIASFKVREGMPVGAMVTLRGKVMYEFIDRIVNIVLPRVKDLKPLSPNAIDSSNNFNIGIKDHTTFPEIDFSSSQNTFGMNICINIVNSVSKDQTVALLRGFNFPIIED